MSNPTDTETAPLTPEDAVRGFDRLDRSQVAFAGGKGANLGELTAAGMPVPEGFVVGAPAYAAYCTQTGLRERLSALLDRLDVEDTAALQQASRQAQELFDATGGVHAAGAFTADGEVLLVREDIGRHNTVDKVVGRMLLDGSLPATGLGLYVSGRASFEIVQKAWAAGFSAVVAVSAPSSLAVAAAKKAGITLAGFAREGRLNLYT